MPWKYVPGLKRLPGIAAANILKIKENPVMQKIMDMQIIRPASRPPCWKETVAFLGVALSTLAIPLFLYKWQALDNNSLTAWRWVFTDVPAWRIFAYLFPVIGLAYVLAGFSFYENRPFWLVIVSFAAAAVFWREPEAIMDAARYFTQAKHLELYGAGFFIEEWGKEIFAWTDLPLMPFLYGLIFKWFGEARIFIQIFTTLLFSGTVLLTYLTGRLLWNKEVGFYAGLLLLGIPYLLTQVPLMLVDVPTMFFLMLAIFTFCKALDKGGAKMIVLASLALFLLFFVKFSAWLMLTVLPVVFFYYLRSGPRRIIGRTTAMALLASLFIGTVSIIYYDLLLEQIELLNAYQKPGLKRWTENFSSTFLFQMHPLIAMAAVCSLFTACRKKDYSYPIISYLVLLLIVVMQVKRIRYILPLFPLLTLMGSYGLMEIKNLRLKKFIIFCCVGSSLLLAISVYLPFLQRLSAVNLQTAGLFLNSLEIDQVEVFAIRTPTEQANPAVSVQLLDLFTEKPLVYEDNIAPLERLKHETSSMRFTWEQQNPAYYRMAPEISNQRQAIAIISASPGQPLPAALQARADGFRFSKEFTTSTNLFRYRTLVTVYYN